MFKFSNASQEIGMVMPVILRDVLMLSTPVNIALPKRGSTNQSGLCHHLFGKGGRLNLMQFNEMEYNLTNFLLDLNNSSRVFLCHCIYPA